jgi:tripartite-type tricarboxylate transporter receptor subunit TctC
MIVGFPAGNDYDIAARLLAKYLPKQIPGLQPILVQNMPQAASMVAANYVYSQAPRDGSVFGAVTRNLASQALLGLPNIEADPRRLIWLGGTSFPGRMCLVSDKAKVQTAEALFTQELIVGSVGAGNSTSILPTVMNHVLGTKFRMIEGYQGSPDILLAIQRGEVEGMCSSYGQLRGAEDALREGKLRIIFRAEEAPMREIPDAPSIYDFAKTEAQKQFMRFAFASTEFGRPLAFPPDVPADRVALMRRAIEAAANDPEMLAEAEKLHMDMAWRPPAGLTALVEKLYKTPPEMVETIKKLVPNLQ